VHELYFPVLFDVFPDARVVRLHRDPCVCIASLASLTTRFRRLYTSSVDYEELGRFMLEWFAEGIERSQSQDEKFGSKPIFDISFEALTHDPIDIVRKMYAYFGLTYSRELESVMTDYVKSNSAQQRSYDHKYLLEDFGLSRRVVLDRLERYVAR
jgi:Sulfotransferase family